MLLWFVGPSILLVWSVFRSPAADYRVVAVGALLPLVELPFGEPRLFHSLTGAALVLAAVMLGGTRPAPRAAAPPRAAHRHADAPGARRRVDRHARASGGRSSGRRGPPPSCPSSGAAAFNVVLELAGAGRLLVGLATLPPGRARPSSALRADRTSRPGHRPVTPDRGASRPHGRQRLRPAPRPPARPRARPARRAPGGGARRRGRRCASRRVQPAAPNPGDRGGPRPAGHDRRALDRDRLRHLRRHAARRRARCDLGRVASGHRVRARWRRVAGRAGGAGASGLRRPRGGGQGPRHRRRHARVPDQGGDGLGPRCPRRGRVAHVLRAGVGHDDRYDGRPCRRCAATTSPPTSTASDRGRYGAAGGRVRARHIAPRTPEQRHARLTRSARLGRRPVHLRSARAFSGCGPSSRARSSASSPASPP